MIISESTRFRSLFPKHLEALEPQDTYYTRGKTDSKVKRMQPVKTEEVLKEGNIKDHTQKEEGTSHHPPEGRIWSLQRGKYNAGP